jgi:VWFA-related protein
MPHPASRRLAASFGLTLGLVAGAAWADEGPAEPPRDSGLEEQVRVQLVLVDLLVLDRDDRTVPGLTRDDFVVVVGGRETPIRSLDAVCPSGAAEEPRPGAASTPLADRPTAHPRRIVLAFDYYHMENAADAIDHALAALEKWPTGGEEHMVVSLGRVVRIESAFSSDPAEARRTLERMREDRDLYAGQHGRLTERGFFDQMEILFDLLARWEGRKSIVLFSGPFLPDGFFRDPEFQRLSALSVATRTAVYPVDTGGLRTPIDALAQPFGGPPMLRRLANDTGGRMTAETNEIGLAYARAHRDLGCTYTLGFLDSGSAADRRRRLTIRLRNRPGARVVYPEFFVVRSPEEKRLAALRTAAMAPQLFDSPELTAELFVLAPLSSSRWRTLLGVEYRPGAEAPIRPGSVFRLKGIVRKPNGTIVQAFDETLALPAADPPPGRVPALTLFREIRTRPGRYVVSAVLSDPGSGEPLATTRPARVAEIPRGEPFLVGPLLGRNGTGAGVDPAFEPLVLQEAAQGEPLDSRTVICVVGRAATVDVREIGRSVTTSAGQGALRFPPATARLAGRDGVSCHVIVDRVATAALPPGLYDFVAVAATAQGVSGRSATRFTILPARPE